MVVSNLSNIDEIVKGLKAPIAQLVNIDQSQIDPDAPLVSYGLDSMTFFNLSFELEEKYGLNIMDEQVTMDVTLNQLAKLILEKQKNGKGA